MDHHRPHESTWFLHERCTPGGYRVGMLLLALGCRLLPPHYDPAPVLDGLGDWSPEGVPDEVWDQGRTDFDRPSDRRRMWVLDLAAHEVLHELRVAHGSGSGDRRAARFSDRVRSHESSLGLYAAAGPYEGKHGRSLRLDGLEPANASARRRSIVVHGADYVDDDYVAREGAAWRSNGCFALDPDEVAAVVADLDGALLFARASDPSWASPWLTCGD
jgi:hypothetical protein